MTYFNYIIIGGGISGLYCALKLTLKYPDIKIVILEKNDYLGGRILMDTFCGKHILVGANSGRYHIDKNLKELCKRYNLPIEPKNRKVSYIGFEPIDIMKYVNDMKNNKDNLDRSKTFKQNFINLYGKKIWENFVLSNGYTEFGEADVFDMLNNYTFIKSTDDFVYFPVDWDLLKERLINELKNNGVNIYKNTDVIKVKRIISNNANKNNNNNNFMIETINTKSKSKKVFDSEKIIFATNIYGLKHLYDNGEYHKYITSQIECQQAMRLYAKVSDPIKEIKTSFVITNNFLQKIMDVEDNIYMISASDNDFARNINKMSMNVLRNKLQNMFDINVCKIAKYFWPCAFHFFKPLKYFNSRDDFIKIAQHPEENVYVIGEVVAKQHWWVEGALESVNNLFH